MLDRLTVEAAARARSFTSVALDRFSGAPIDQALFATRAFVGTRLAIVLRLDAREEAASEAFVERLIQDLKDDPLDLGHGSAKGFGWFGVEEKT
jgi:hypothetical protein